jgi:Domain of unknown function (DUF4124)
MSASKLFLIALLISALAMLALWFTPAAVRADIAKKLQPQAAETALTGTAKAPVTTTVYKWTDSSGQAHFSNAPPKNQKYETVTYRNDANVIGAN